MVSQWPLFKEEWNNKENEKDIDTIKEAVRTFEISVQK